MSAAARCGLPYTTLALALCIAGAAQADNFVAARYEAANDQLVVTVVYRGTNSDRQFTLNWGACQLEKGVQTVSAEVLDSQPHDAARRTFKKTVHFDLSGIPCRAVDVVLRTAPRFYTDVQVPAAP